MTAKRFTIKPSMIVDDVTVIIDNQKEYTFPVLDSTLNYMFCKALNEQHETIERLKNNCKVLDEVKCEIAEENEQLKYSLSAYMVDLNNYKGRCSALEQENESLKEENKFLRNKIATYKSGNALLKKTLDKEWK